MESNRRTYLKPEITIVEFFPEKGFSASIGVPTEILIGDPEIIGSFEKDGFSHSVAGRVDRSSGESKGWF